MERGAYVYIRMPVLDIDDRGAVCIVKDILRPDELERIEIETHEISAVIGKKNVVVDYRSR